MDKDLAQEAIEEIAFYCNQSEENPEGAPWLRNISKLSESNMESLRVFMNSGVFTKGEIREIIKGFSERTDDVMSKSMEAAYADVLQTIKEEQNEPPVLALRRVRRKLWYW